MEIAHRSGTKPQSLQDAAATVHIFGHRGVGLVERARRLRERAELAVSEDSGRAARTGRRWARDGQSCYFGSRCWCRNG